MSVVTEITIFPLGYETGLSKYVKQVVTRISEFGYPYTVTAMGTIIETNTLDEALAVITASYQTLEPFAQRVYCSATFDITKSGQNRIESKVASVREEV